VAIKQLEKSLGFQVEKNKRSGWDTYDVGIKQWGV